MYYNIHTHTWSGKDDIVEIVNMYPYEATDTPYFSSGIHPWYINQETFDAQFAVIRQRLKMKSCLAVGECGLDKRIEIPFGIQTDIFEKHILLAKEFQKPLILHMVGAFQELIAIKKRMNPEVPIVIHGFSKNEKVAKQLLDNGFYLSFGKYLLRNPELSGVLKQVPSDRFFLETDTIEEGIETVYAKAAQARNTDVEEIKNIVSTNFKNVFANG